MRKDKTDKFIEDAFKEMFKRVGEKYPNIELTNHKDWYMMRSWSEKEQESFKQWLMKRLKKTFSYMSARKLELEACMFILSYGWTNTEHIKNGNKNHRRS